MIDIPDGVPPEFDRELDEDAAVDGVRLALFHARLRAARRAGKLSEPGRPLADLFDAFDELSDRLDCPSIGSLYVTLGLRHFAARYSSDAFLPERTDDPGVDE